VGSRRARRRPSASCATTRRSTSRLQGPHKIASSPSCRAVRRASSAHRARGEAGVRPMKSASSEPRPSRIPGGEILRHRNGGGDCVARADLAAMRANGLTLRSEGQTLVTHPAAPTTPRAGPAGLRGHRGQAHSCPRRAPIQHLPASGHPGAGDQRRPVVLLQVGGPWEDTRLESVDPGASSGTLPARRVIGASLPRHRGGGARVIEHTYPTASTWASRTGRRASGSSRSPQLMIKPAPRSRACPHRENLWVKLWATSPST